ncbi:phosphate ABC transporter ATP-binding protein PstB [Entomobacter blattae]|uniref:Phosphate import ATP-binding protein PstB n=1 Tax=Entomobacter blattae TaxID=2762277 RepID=A0A7H1NNW1_9PROT|nr:phosphate ABC transporter ATP-binding protein PstB [Entomobacter blattae]QNT77471.1 Phosphate import ATP-binding protein PstB [Entomobacter blattae]
MTPAPIENKTILSIEKLNFFYGHQQTLYDITMNVPAYKVTGLIGPSGCGKSTLLRTLNRMYDLYPEQRAEGTVLFEDYDILSSKIDLDLLRTKIGMVFQRPTAFSMSIFDNIAFGIRLHEKLNLTELEERITNVLQQVTLWNEVKDRLHHSALSLSGGQQQRLCIARALATKPEILLMDEPTSALDPISTAHIEELLDEICQNHSIIIVTHNLQQAARCTDQVGFLFQGKLVELNASEKLFTAPENPRTQDYITGRFG